MATGDIYGRDGTQVAGVFSADSALLVCGDLGTEMVTSNFGLTYNQQITRVYSLLKQGTYYIVGRTRGNANFGNIVGPAGASAAFIDKYGNACNAAGNNIQIKMGIGCGGTAVVASVNRTMKGVVIENIGWTMTSQDMIINERVDAMFSGLDR